MRKLPVFVLALLLGLVSIGCDSEDEDSDAEVFLGTWALVGLTDGGGDKTALFGQIATSLTADFEADKTFDVLVDYTQQPDFSLAGTYQIDEGQKKIVLQTAGRSASFDYNFESDTRMTLSAHSDIVNGMFETEIYTGTVTITIAKQ